MAGALRLGTSYLALGTAPLSLVTVPGGGDGGTITINVNRTQFEVAPDSVRFTVDLDSSSFDTAGPTGSEIYDARLHDLIFLWDFDDAASGDWTAPVNVLPAWKNRNVAKGPFVAHMYTSPRPASGGAGTGYNVSVMVIEPSSGKMATANVEIFVEDPDVVYGGSGATYADTIVVNPVGDSNFSLKPVANAYEVNADTISSTDTWFVNVRDETPKRKKRILFKRGASFDDVEVNMDTHLAGLYFGDYGDPNEPKPILNGRPKSAGESDSIQMFKCSGVYADELEQDGIDPAADLRFVNLDWRGSLDPSTQLVTDLTNTSAGLFSSRGLDGIFSSCDWSGLRFAVTSGPGGAGNLGKQSLHLDNCTMSAFGASYPLFAGPAFGDGSSYTLTGCRFVQTPDAHDSDGTSGTRAILRTEHKWLNHARGCDTYHTDHTQSHFKFVEGGRADGAIVNIHSCATEGGSHSLNFNGTKQNGLNRCTVHNIIVDGIVHIASHAGKSGVSSYATGMTVRNSLISYPNVPAKNGAGQQHYYFVLLTSSGSDPFDATIVGDAPVRIYNNSFITERTTAQNQGIVPTDIFASVDITNVIGSNNISHRPNASAASPHTPFERVKLWDPVNPGWRDPSLTPFDPSFATPTGSIPYTGTVACTPGETVTSSGGGTATVVRQDGDASSGTLFVREQSGFTVSNGDTLTGSSTLAATASGGITNEGAITYRLGSGSTGIGAATVGSTGDKIAFHQFFDQFSQTAVASRSLGHSEPS